MSAVAFDSLNYFEKLKEAGVPEAQARAQAENFRHYAEALSAQVKSSLREYDDAKKDELATKSDIYEIKLEIEKIRAEVENNRIGLEKFRAEISAEMGKLELRLVKWIISVGIAMALIMAKGFHWLGF